MHQQKNFNRFPDSINKWNQLILTSKLKRGKEKIKNDFFEKHSTSPKRLSIFVILHTLSPYNHILHPPRRRRHTLPSAHHRSPPRATMHRRDDISHFLSPVFIKIKTGFSDRLRLLQATLRPEMYFPRGRIVCAP